MTPEQIQEAAVPFVTAIWTERHSHEETDLSVIGSNPYKPFYGAISTLTHPCSAFRKDILGGQMLTLEDAVALCKAAHPWFVDAIDRDMDSFALLYEDFVEIWGD